MSDTVKLIIEIPKWKYKSICEGVEASKIFGFLGADPDVYEAIYNGTPLEDVKAKIKKLRSHSARFRTSDGRVVYVDSQDIFDVLDSIGSEVKPNDIR